MLGANLSASVRDALAAAWSTEEVAEASISSVKRAVLASGAVEQAIADLRAEVASAQQVLGKYALQRPGLELLKWGEKLATHTVARSAV